MKIFRSFESPALVYLAHLAFRGGIDKFRAHAQDTGSIVLNKRSL